MQIDVSNYSHMLSTLNIDEEVIIPKEYFENTEIKDLKNVRLVGSIEEGENNYIQKGKSSPDRPIREHKNPL